MQLDTFAATQLYHGHTNRVGTSGRPRGKHAMRPIVRRRRTQQFEATGAIEFPEDNEMREAFDVGEPRLEIGQDLEHAICLVFSPKTLGNLACVLVWATHKSNRL